MLFNYIILLTIISNVLSLKLNFKGNDLIYLLNRISSHEIRNKMCYQFYDDLVKDNYYCAINSFEKYNFNLNSYKLISDIGLLFHNYLSMSKDEFEIMYLENKEYINLISNNYNKFFSESKYYIEYLGKKIAQYYLNKFDYLYNTTKSIISSYTVIDENSNKIIFPDNSYLLYFTTNTINNYTDCIEFLNSLKNTTCFTVKKEILDEYVNVAKNYLNNIKN